MGHGAIRRIKSARLTDQRPVAKKSIIHVGGSKPIVTAGSTHHKHEGSDISQHMTVMEKNIAAQESSEGPETPSHPIHVPDVRFEPYSVDRHGGERPVSPVLQCGEKQPL